MRRRDRRVLIGSVIFAVVLLVAAVLTVMIFKRMKQEPVVAVYQEQEKPEDVVRWKNQEYRYNDHLSNYLFIGVDKYEVEAGQCDALFLLSYDRVTKDIAVISIPRDTMTDIEVFLADGTSGGMSRNHISLSYSFGDGAHESCQLTKEAVSHLFYGLYINGYCAMNMSGLPVIPEVIGEFEVVVPDDSLVSANPQWKEGSTVMITSENAEDFVRYRDIEVSMSALARQGRQRVFLEAAMEKLEKEFAKDQKVVTELYEALTPHLVTSMGNDLFLELMEAVASGTEVVSWTLPGEGITGDVYDEYRVDDELLYEKIIETFYKKVEQ